MSGEKRTAFINTEHTCYECGRKTLCYKFRDFKKVYNECDNLNIDSNMWTGRMEDIFIALANCCMDYIHLKI